MCRRFIEKYKGRKIFRSMFVASFSLAAACIFLACVFGFWWFRESQLKDDKQNADNMLYASSLMVDNYINSVKDTMEILRNDTYVKRQMAKDTYFWDDDMGIAAREIINTMTVNPVFHSIYVLRDGEYRIKCSNPSYPLNEQADKNMVELFYRSSFGQYMPWYYIDIYGKSQAMLSLADGEQNPSTGEKESGILISIDIGRVMESILPPAREGEQYLLADGDGSVIYATGGRFANGEKAGEEELLAFMKQCESRQSEIVRLEDGKYLLTCINMGDGFYLTHMLPYRYIAAPIDHMRNTFILIGFLLVILILLLAFGMSNWVYSPIEAVVKTTGASGQLSEDMSGRLGNTELASIARTYHTMVQALNNLNMQKEQEELAQYLTTRSVRKRPPEWVEETYGKEDVRFRALCLRISDTVDLHENNTEEAIAFEIKTISNVVEQVLKPLGEVLTTPVDKEYIAVILFAGQSFSEEELEERIREIFTVTKELVQIGMDAGISNEKSSFDELASTYQMARAATAYRFMYGVNAIITENEMAQKALGSGKAVDTEKLIRLLKDCDREGFAQEYFDIIEELKQSSIQSAREELVNMAAEILKYYNSLHYNFAALSGADYEKLNSELSVFAYIDDAREWFFRIADEIWDMLVRARLSGREDIVDRALSYLNENYADPNISAQYIADMFQITPSYFSRLFNERSGYAFPDYLATLRIEKAKELLLTDSHRSIQEICELVGYTNSSYFTATFRKKFGITPGQFRKNHLKSDEN